MTPSLTPPPDIPATQAIGDKAMIIKVSTTLMQHYAREEADRYALCGEEVYPHHPGDERHTIGLCEKCEKQAAKLAAAREAGRVWREGDPLPF